jgi:hypothetical protein
MKQSAAAKAMKVGRIKDDERALWR